MSTKHPTDFDPADSVLFLGSGFSRDSKNIRNQHLPTHSELKHEFAAMLDVPADTYNLQTLADEIASRPQFNLYNTLYELFTVQSLTEQQLDLLQFPWRRVYTTNYDDAIEYGYFQGGIAAPSYSYGDPKPRKLRDRSVIHLHGAIRWATDDNVLQQLVLSEESYARQHFDRSQWYDELQRDRRFCRAFFFVGYSLHDYHISALLLQDPRQRDKTYFVNGRLTDPIFATRISNYGSALAISAAELPALCHSLPRPSSATSPAALKAFRHLDPFKDKKTLLPATPLEILNLVTYGTFNYQRFLSSFPTSSYAVPRRGLLDDAIQKLDHAPCLLVHSFLGNGKSIFLYSLSYALSEAGYRCLYCRPTATAFPQDIDLLRSLGKLAFFFDSHNSALDMIDDLRDLPSETRFVVAVRSSVLDLRRHVLEQKLPNPIETINLNRISKNDKVVFQTILDRAGVGVQNLSTVVQQSTDFREIVTTLYDNTAIRKEIRTALEPLLADRAVRSILVTSHLLRFNGEEASPAILRTVTGTDPYSAMLRFPTIVADIFGLSDEGTESSSALFSEYMLQNHIATADITESVYSLAVAAVRRRNEPRHRAILSKVIRYSRLNRALRRDPERSEALGRLYERLARDADINREPLFWLQYAILMGDQHELLAAERFITTAYTRAAAIPNFRTYQIDTYALYLLMEIEQAATDVDHVSRFGDILEKLERVRWMIGDEHHLLHAVRAIGGVEGFVSRRVAAFSVAERRVMRFRLDAVATALEQLSDHDRERTEAPKICASVRRAAEILIHGALRDA